MENPHWVDTWNVALNYLKKGQIGRFGEGLIELFRLINCFSCLIGEVKNDVQELITILELDTGTNDNFLHNFSKGFIYLIDGQEEKAYNFLTLAIINKPSLDLPYALRANVNCEINSQFKNDARKAVLLNPSSFNYFTLGRMSAVDSLDKSILYFRKAAKKSPDFSCAYNKLGIIYKGRKDYINAYWNFQQSVDLKPNSWNLKMLYKSLYKAGKFKEALEISINGDHKYPEKKRFLLYQGRAYFKLQDYKKAISFYEAYLLRKPTNHEIKAELALVQNLFYKNIINEAKARYDNNDLHESLSLIVDNLTFAQLDGENINFFFHGLLKYYKWGNDINAQNPIYIQLKSLSEVCRVKYDKDENPTIEEESAYKLVNNQSRYYLDSIIGFGIHRGKTINELIEENPDYLLWCVISLNHFSLPQILFLNPKLKIQANYLPALEFNLVKNLLIEEWETNYQNQNNSYYISDYSDDERPQSYGDWLNSEFGEEAGTAYWNLD